jgi:hypothetical protein
MPFSSSASLQFEGHQLAVLLVREPVGREQAVLALEVEAGQVDQRIGLGHEHLVLENHAVHVARRGEQLVAVGGDRRLGHGRIVN